MRKSTSVLRSEGGLTFESISTTSMRPTFREEKSAMALIVKRARTTAKQRNFRKMPTGLDIDLHDRNSYFQ